MENQDKIFEQFKNAAAQSEVKGFPAMEKVWSRVEEKLDQKNDKKVIALWKKAAVAASLLLFFSIGYQFLKSDVKINPAVSNETNVVSNDVPDTIQPPTPKTEIVTTEKENPIIKENAPNLLGKQLERQKPLAWADSAAGKKTQAKLNASAAIDKPVAAVLMNTEGLGTASAKPEPLKVETTITTNAITGEQTITGTVTDNTKLPIPGVNVTIKGKAIGTITDFDGKFSIQAEKNDLLIFSFIGFNDAVAIVGKDKKIDISLIESSQTLSEVVVTGYGMKKKKSMVSYATSTVAASDVSAKKSSRKKNSAPESKGSIEADSRTQGYFSKSLQGKVAGVQVAQNGTPGVEKLVTIRGVASMNNQGEPLYVVDGLPINAREFAALKPENIQSVSVLKDTSVTAIYGARAANGVIVVTTKNGNVQRLSKREIRKNARLLKKAQKENPQSAIEIPQSAEEPSNEDYDSFIENPFESPKAAPLSTFSIDVDNASYTNVRRFINNGQSVPKDAVRVEEMVNFFKYQYPQPTGQNPFSINTEYSDCPWNSNHKLVKIGLQGKIIETGQLPASNLVFLIDVSGSMSDQNKLPLLKESMKILVNELRKKDKVAIVVYAGAAGVVLPPTSGDDKQTIINALENLNAGGSTAGGQGIELAYKLAVENFVKGGNNRVVLATDGDFNVGSSSNTDMQTLIEEKRKSGVFLTCLGYGMGNYKDSKMEILSDKGNGNYAYIDNIQEANRFLGKEFKGSMFAIAKDVKIQIEFNPKHVQSYRLIGYENRKLRPEDFTNDAIDAGELGSGHTVTALYEIIPTGIKSDYFNETPGLKYTQTQTGNNFNDELATVKFRYKKPDGDKSIEMVQVIDNKPVPAENTSGDFKFSAAVAWFGLKLRDSKLITNKSSEAILKLAKKGLSNDTEGYKSEFIRLVETVK